MEKEKFDIDKLSTETSDLYKKIEKKQEIIKELDAKKWFFQKQI